MELKPKWLFRSEDESVLFCCRHDALEAIHQFVFDVGSVGQVV